MTVPTFDDLLELMIAANDPSPGYSGTLTEVEAGEIQREIRVWRWRDLMRIEDPPGDARLLAGERMLWCARDDYSEEVWELRDPDGVPGDAGTAYLLDARDEWTEWLTADRDLVTRTLRPVEYDGRAAWEFSAPKMKGGSPTLTVDAELGLVVRMARDDLDAALQWRDVRVEPDLTPSFFEPTHRDRAKRLPLPSGTPEPTDDERELDGCLMRLRILDGLVRALDDVHGLVDVLMASRSWDESVAAVRERFHLDDVQVLAVLDMQFRRIDAWQRERIVEERDQLVARVGELRADGG